MPLLSFFLFSKGSSVARVYIHDHVSCRWPRPRTGLLLAQFHRLPFWGPLSLSSSKAGTRPLAGAALLSHSHSKGRRRLKKISYISGCARRPLPSRAISTVSALTLENLNGFLWLLLGLTAAASLHTASDQPTTPPTVRILNFWTCIVFTAYPKSQCYGRAARTPSRALGCLTILLSGRLQRSIQSLRKSTV